MMTDHLFTQLGSTMSQLRSCFKRRKNNLSYLRENDLSCEAKDVLESIVPWNLLDFDMDLAKLSFLVASITIDKN
jgi:hypothetical protein